VAAGAAEAVIPPEVEVICGRAKIVVSEGKRLRELRADAFVGLELDELVIPRTLEVIAVGAFREMAGPRTIRASRNGHFIEHSGLLLSRDRTELTLGQTDLVTLSASRSRASADWRRSRTRRSEAHQFGLSRFPRRSPLPLSWRSRAYRSLRALRCRAATNYSRMKGSISRRPT